MRRYGENRKTEGRRKWRKKKEKGGREKVCRKVREKIEKRKRNKKDRETKSEKPNADEGDRKERKSGGGLQSILNPFHLYPIYDLAPDNPVTLC